MPLINSSSSTGIASLDQIFLEIKDGDNIVWNINSISDYKFFVSPYVEKASKSGKKVIYFRFAKHKPLLTKNSPAQIIHLNAKQSFEAFIARIHNVIQATGPAAAYVFDCLSDLAADWSSDRMLGNFFLLICPYVYGHGGTAYFSLQKKQHSFHAIQPVSETAQILADVYNFKKCLYVHPLKVQYRYSNKMFMLYAFKNSRFIPVTDSSRITEVFNSSPSMGLESANYTLGFWSKSFAKAAELQKRLDSGEDVKAEVAQLTDQLMRMLIAREGKMLELARANLNLNDLLNIRRRMIGTGLIGGKSTGLVLAQAILKKHNQQLHRTLAPHDSFFIGADVFYTYLVQNGLWWIKQKQKDPNSFLEAIELTRYQLLKGQFPEYIIKQFANLLDYFGQSPIIIRSSSLLEDDFENSFAGKAESVILANQGSHNDRMVNLISAIQRVYASNMSKEVLQYRASRGLLHKDEQMAVLIQRIYGTTHERIFFPHLAGVGLSFNPYVWNDQIDPQSGVLRLVFGLGTRAVENNGEEHIRLVALNAPSLQLQDQAEMCYQQKADVLTLESGQISHLTLEEIAKSCPELPMEMLASRDERLVQIAKDSKFANIFPYSLTFEKILQETPFVQNMRKMLKILEKNYGNPVDIEFAVNVYKDGSYKINLIQCRPIQLRTKKASKIIKNIKPASYIIKSESPVIGRSREMTIYRIIYVVPAEYAELPMQERYALARFIGEILKQDKTPATMLIGPGRWGTTSPALGIPITFPEIKSVNIICEISEMHENLIPDLSLGSHFFNELIETDILYFTIQPQLKENFINQEFFHQVSKESASLFPGAEKWEKVLKIMNFTSEKISFIAVTEKQKTFLYSK